MRQIEIIKTGVAWKDAAARSLGDLDLDIEFIVIPQGEMISGYRTFSKEYLVVTRGSGRLEMADGAGVESGKGYVVSLEPEISVRIINAGFEPLEFLILKPPPADAREMERTHERYSEYLTFCTRVLFTCRVLAGSPNDSETIQGW